MSVDLRVWRRQIRRHPGTLLVAIVALATGIGAVTALHAIVDATLLHPLPGVEAGDLFALRRGDERTSLEWYGYPDFRLLQERDDLFASVVAVGRVRPDLLLAANGASGVGVTLMVSPGYFETLGVSMLAGRAFTENDHQQSAAPAVILTAACWRSRFSGDPGVLGREMTIGTTRATIVGITVDGFAGTNIEDRADVFLPIEITQRVHPVPLDRFGDRSPLWLHLIGRLRPSLTKAQTEAALEAMSSRHGQRPLGYSDVNRLVPLNKAAIPSRYWNDFETLTSLFALAAGALLLVACLTVGTLLRARDEARRTDVAVCLALGASRARLLLAAWIDGLLPTLVGGLLALAVARGLLVLVSQLAPPSASRITDVVAHLDVRVLVGAAGVALFASAMICAIASRAVLTASAGDLLRIGGASSTTTARRTRRALVVAQVAGASALLAFTLLLSRSLAAVYAVDLGYRTSGLVEATVDLTAAPTPPAERQALFQAVERQLRDAFPGEAVGRSGREWLVPRGAPLLPESVSTTPDSGPPGLLIKTVGPGYFEALGVPLRAGRAFAEADLDRQPSPALLSESLARRLTPAGAPLGLRLGGVLGEVVVIGVIADFRLTPFTRARPTVYMLPHRAPDFVLKADMPVMAQPIPTASTFVIRTEDVAKVRAIIRAALAAKPATHVDILTTTERIGRDALAQRVGLVAVGLLTVTAILLASLSMYVLVTSTVLARTRELAIRVTLGAGAAHVGRWLFRETLAPVALGVILGLVLAINTTHLLRRVLFGVTTTDALSLASAAAVVLAVAVGLGMGPIARAVRCDPSRTLREM